MQGLVKQCYVGGWVFRKELEKVRRYMWKNMFFLFLFIRQSLNVVYDKCCLLEDYVIVQYVCIKENILLCEVFDVIESRQFRECGFLYICDLVYNFILKLEEIRV